METDRHNGAHDGSKAGFHISHVYDAPETQFVCSDMCGTTLTAVIVQSSTTTEVDYEKN